MLPHTRFGDHAPIARNAELARARAAPVDDGEGCVMRTRVIAMALGAAALVASAAFASQSTLSEPKPTPDPSVQPGTTLPPAPRPLLRLKTSFMKGQMVSFDGEKYTPAYLGDDLEKVLAVLPGAAQEFRSARGTHQAALGLGGVGGAVLGFAMGYGLTRKDGWQNSQTYMAAGGGALALAGSLLEVSANNKLRRAVEDYNVNAPRPITLRIIPPRPAPLGEGPGVRLRLGVGF